MQTFKPQITAAVKAQDQDAVDTILTDSDVTDPFLFEMIGTLEDPGTITQFSLAGMASGDNALDTGAAANPHNFNPANRATGLNVSWTVLSVEALEFAREHAGEMVTNINETTRNLVNAIIVRSIEDDAYGPGDAIRDLDAIFDDTARARNIAINESTIAYNKGVDKRWEASGVVVAAVWQTVRDQFVDAVCRGLHGQTADIGGEFVHKGGGDEDQQKLSGTVYKTPPAHIGCRCFKRPVTIPLSDAQQGSLDDAVKVGGVPPEIDSPKDAMDQLEKLQDDRIQEIEDALTSPALFNALGDIEAAIGVSFSSDWTASSVQAWQEIWQKSGAGTAGFIEGLIAGPESEAVKLPQQ